MRVVEAAAVQLSPVHERATHAKSDAEQGSENLSFNSVH